MKLTCIQKNMLVTKILQDVNKINKMDVNSDKPLVITVKMNKTDGKVKAVDYKN